MKNKVIASAGSPAAVLAARCVILLHLCGEFTMRPLLIVAAALPLVGSIPAFAQAGLGMATPSLGVTSSLGVAPGESIGPNGLPLSASPGGSTVPSGLTGTITVPNASSGAACSTVATSPLGTFGSPTTYDGGGMAAGTTTPAAAATPGGPSP